MKKTLIVIDMQNDFIDGALGSKEARDIVPRVQQKIAEYRERGDEIIFTRDTHNENYMETSEGMNLPVPHCVLGTHGWEISDKLEVGDAEVINKQTFGWTHWQNHSFAEIEIVGLCTDICVVSNALILKAMFPEVPITVDASCCAGVTPESHNAAIDTMRACQVNVINEGGEA